MKQIAKALAATAALTLGACAMTSDKATTASDGASQPSLAGTSWRLVEYQSMDDTQGTTKPDDPAKYTISFGADGRAAVRLDCNRGMGQWTVDGSGVLSIGPLATTKVFCPPPSLGDQIGARLGEVRSYVIRDGRLSMALPADAGIIVWEPAANGEK